MDYVGLGTATDAEVWDFALANDFMIVTKDADFSELIVLRGFPPKVIWIRRGNCSTQDIEDLLRTSFDEISMLSDNDGTGILTLFQHNP